MFRPRFGECSCCGKPGLVVVKSGLIKQCNEQKKKDGKKDKPKKEKKVKKPLKKSPVKKKLNFGKCISCGNETLLVVNAGLCKICNEKIKREKKKEKESKRIVKLVNNAEKKKSHPQLKKQLWDIFSEFIRLRDSKDGMFTCISCGKLQSAAGGNLQAGHYYKSQLHPALRYEITNVNSQCRQCNVFLEGNRQGYEIGLIKKYGQKAIDDLKLRAHNKAKLGRFELELLIKEFTQKLNKLKQEKNHE